MRNFYLFSLLLCARFGYAQLPPLIEVLSIGCGEEIHYAHDPTGNPDRVGIRLNINWDSCLPQKIYYRHYAYSIKDRLDLFLQAPNQVWVHVHTIDWHSGTVIDSLEIPEWAISLMFVGSNNLHSQTFWDFAVWCQPKVNCCRFEVVLEPQDTVCPGDSVLIVAKSAGTPPYDYFWNYADTMGTNQFWIETNEDGSNNVAVKVYDSLGCIGISWIDVPVKKPVYTDEVDVCPGVDIDLPQIPGVVWPVDKINGLTQDTVILANFSDDGCEFEVPLWINLQEAPEPLKDTSICIGRYVLLDTRYEWNINQEIKVLKDTIFVGVIKDTLGCIWHDTLQVKALWCWDSTQVYIPNVFAPGSVDNGLFQVFVQLDAMKDIHVQEIQIWSRWGQLIFSSNGNEPVWDGRCADGQMANPAVFVARLLFSTPEGTVSIFRDVTLIRK